MENWKINVVCNDKTCTCTWEDFESWKDDSLPVEEVIPGKKGEAVAFQTLLDKTFPNTAFSKAVFTASDGFSQTVDREELNSAFFVYKQNGEPLKKGFPTRLYVPTSKSDCLNVKSVVEINLS